MKVFFIIASLVSVAFAVQNTHYKIPPKPYAYQYGVQDDYAGVDFKKSEAQDSAGVVNGEYRVQLPDGRLQIVTYRADHHGGYTADVKYEGVAQYPQHHKKTYGHSA